jgi:hypothetical protein
LVVVSLSSTISEGNKEQNDLWLGMARSKIAQNIF